MNDSDWLEVQQKIGYQFRNQMLLRQAFISPSVTDATQNRVQNYQLLEFFGDAVLSLAVVKNLSDEFCQIDSYVQLISFASLHHLSDEKGGLIKNERLAQSSLALGFENLLMRAHGHFSYDRKNKKGDLVEAVLGAVALDSDWDMDIVSLVARNMLEYVQSQKDYWTLLLNMCKKQLLPPQEVSFWECKTGIFDCAVSLFGVKEVFAGSGRTLDEAQQVAAENAYRYLTSSQHFSSILKKADTVSKGMKENFIEQLNRKYLAKEISLPKYEFSEVKSGSLIMWLCNCSLPAEKISFFAKAGKNKRQNNWPHTMCWSTCRIKIRYLLFTDFFVGQ